VKASLVIPTLNEVASIGHVLDTFRRAADAANPTLFPQDPLDWEVLVVDGHSSDGTAEAARARGARVIDEPRKGYGRAYRTGFAAVTGEIVATLDGDATYPAEEVPRLVRYLIDRRLDFLTADRLSTLEGQAMTREHRIGNRVLNLFMHLAYHRYFQAAAGATITDSQSGMWVFRRAILDRVRLTQDGMPMSEELKLEVLLKGLRFEEVPIHYSERWGAPKLSSWRDGWQNLQFLITKRLETHRETRERSRAAIAGAGEPTR
jgi:dolichol-phosphate hexosyltransferase